MISVYSDGSFATNKDDTSKLGYLIFMAYKYIKANVIDYARNKSKRWSDQYSEQKRFFQLIHATQ